MHNSTGYVITQLVHAFSRALSSYGALGKFGEHSRSYSSPRLSSWATITFLSCSLIASDYHGSRILKKLSHVASSLTRPSDLSCSYGSVNSSSAHPPRAIEGVSSRKCLQIFTQSFDKRTSANKGTQNNFGE